MTAPKRIWAFYSEIFGPMWIDKVDEGGTEYVRADLHDATAQEDQTDEALPADIEKMAYTAGYIDGNCGCTHKFSGQIGVAIGDEYGLAIEPQPDPRDEVIARLVEALQNMLDGYQEWDMVGTTPVLRPNHLQTSWIQRARAAIAAAKGGDT